MNFLSALVAVLTSPAQVLFLHKKDIFLGKAEYDISDLLTMTELPSITLTLIDEKTRRPTGGSVTVSASVRAPWNGDKITTEVVEDVIIMDDKTSPQPPPSVAQEYLRLIKGGGIEAVHASSTSSASASACAAPSSAAAHHAVRAPQHGKPAPKASGPSGKVVVQLDKTYKDAKVSERCCC